MRNKAFTLAEVLITLGIIGVVAAMTLSTITQKVEKIILKSQIKKSYSYLSQAYQKVLFEFGDFVRDDNSAEGFGYKQFHDAMLASLKIIKRCEKNALAKNCVPKYVGLNVAQCSGFNENSVYNNKTVYILSDGAILMPYHEDWRALWLIDVNGLKGPNKAGYDLFEVQLDGSNNRMQYKGKGCLNQRGEVQGGLDDYKNLEKW